MTSPRTEAFVAALKQLEDDDDESSLIALFADGAAAAAALEWTSQGRLQGGRSLTYSGVSLLTFDDDERIQPFATYFDTAAFVSQRTAAH